MAAGARLGTSRLSMLYLDDIISIAAYERGKMSNDPTAVLYIRVNPDVLDEMCAVSETFSAFIAYMADA